MPVHVLAGLAAGTLGAGVAAAAGDITNNTSDAQYALITAIAGIVTGIVTGMSVVLERHRRRRTGMSPPAPDGLDTLDTGRRLTAVEQVVHDLRDDLKDDFAVLRADLRADRVEVRAELTALGERITRLESRRRP